MRPQIKKNTHTQKTRIFQSDKLNNKDYTHSHTYTDTLHISIVIELSHSMLQINMNTISNTTCIYMH